MNVILDDEQWQAATNTTLGDILADLSDRAHAKSRIVTTMTLDQCRITDRDLDQQFLQESTTRYSDLRATSSTQQDILKAAHGSIVQYQELVIQEGMTLVTQFRIGIENLAALDLWLGKVADMLELMENDGFKQTSGRQAQSTAGWIDELLTARSLRDLVRMADLLEYEIVPRLSA